MFRVFFIDRVCLQNFDFNTVTIIVVTVIAMLAFIAIIVNSDHFVSFLDLNKLLSFAHHYFCLKN